MQYNFSEILEGKENLLDIFIDKYLHYFIAYDNGEGIEIVSKYYKDIFEILNRDFTLVELLEIFQKLAEYKITNDIPYLLMSNEIHGLKNIFISKIFDMNKSETYLKIVLLLFKDINEKIAHIYLVRYINSLIMSNNIRLNSIHDMVEVNVIHYYEAHLIWLSDLAQHIKHQDKRNFVQLNDKLCTFGKWLHDDAKKVIKNNSKYKTILNLHKNLHLFASKIYANLEYDEYYIFLSYLEKCEFISLSLGTELALIDNTQMNQKIKKDELTGALNRNSLKGVFENQYELTLAINNSFLVAMCDLDFFKKINDTYGHVAGDKVLANFVKIAKKHIRNSDLIIRYGGEEFVILLSSIKKSKGLEVLENIRKDFEQSYIFYNESKIKTTVSIGMMEISPTEIYQSKFVDTYINSVDQKLYMAKHNGRNRIEVY